MIEHQSHPASPVAAARPSPLRTITFWLAAFGVVLVALLAGGGAFVVSDNDPASLLAALLLVIVGALVGGFIVRRGGWSPGISWGLFGGVALLLALAAIAFVLGLVVLLVFVAIWIVQASKQP